MYHCSLEAGNDFPEVQFKFNLLSPINVSSPCIIGRVCERSVVKNNSIVLIALETLRKITHKLLLNIPHVELMQMTGLLH